MQTKPKWILPFLFWLFPFLVYVFTLDITNNFYLFLRKAWPFFARLYWLTIFFPFLVYCLSTWLYGKVVKQWEFNIQLHKGIISLIWLGGTVFSIFIIPLLFPNHQRAAEYFMTFTIVGLVQSILLLIKVMIHLFKARVYKKQC